MATYVIPYDPWREKALVTAGTSLLGDFLTNLRQTEQNKKTNAFRGALNDAISSQGQPVTLTPQNVPQGYNSDPWANAFHANNSPLTQFDLGTSSITPRMPASQEIASLASGLAASKRFSMMNPETVQGITNEFTQRAEAERLRGLQQSFSDQLGATKDAGEQMRILAQAVMQGAAPSQVMSPYSEWARHINMSPYQALSLDNALKIAQLRAKSDDYRTDAMIRGQNLDYNTENRRLDITESNNEWQHNNPNLSTYTDEHGYVYAINPITGKATPVTTPSGSQVRGSSINATTAKAEIDSLTKQETELLKARSEAQRRLSWVDTEEEDRTARQALDTIEKDLEAVRKRKLELNEILYPKKANVETISTTKPPTIEEVVASADVKPAPQTSTASADTQPKPDTPLLPKDAVASGLDNSLAASIRKNIIPHTLPGNISDDIPAIVSSADVQQPQPKTPAQPQAISQGQEREFTISDDMKFNPATDTKSLAFTTQHFRKWVKAALHDPRFAGMTTQQVLDYAYDLGIRIED